MQSRRWITVITIAVGLFIALAAFKAMQIRAAIAFGESFPEPSETVEWVRVKAASYPQTLSAPGELVAVQSLVLRNDIEGKITTVGFASGERVEKGQLLLQLDGSEELAQLEAAQAQAELSRLSLQRFRKLMASDASSKDQYDQAVAEHAIANASVRALQAKIRKKTITAPFTAVAGLHQLEIGQFLAANTAIASLTGVSDTLWVDFYLPQHQAGLPTGTHISITAPGILTEPLPGKIIARDADISTRSRNRQFRAELANTGQQLNPGLAVHVTIANPPPLPAIIVPSMAVRYDTIGTFVYIIKPLADTQSQTEWRASRRNVTIGPEFSQQVVIVDGLKEGELVAVNGSYKLRDGMRVNMKPVIGAEAGDEP